MSFRTTGTFCFGIFVICAVGDVTECQAALLCQASYKVWVNSKRQNLPLSAVRSAVCIQVGAILANSLLIFLLWVWQWHWRHADPRVPAIAFVTRQIYDLLEFDLGQPWNVIGPGFYSDMFSTWANTIVSPSWTLGAFAKLDTLKDVWLTETSSQNNSLVED